MTFRAPLRSPLAVALRPFVRPARRTIERGRDGRALAPGITALVAARNEEYTVGFCLRSLIGFVDQIVCIDNGSEDSTLSEMEAFQEEHGEEIEVEVLSMPGALLVDCREAGLRATTRQWSLLWAGDLVARTTGPESILTLRNEVLADNRPRTVQLPYINLIGDLRHTNRIGSVVSPGEPYLMRFGRGIRYREFGRFDAVRFPLYYTQRQESERHMFHLGGLKSDANLIHRFHYFAWREMVNREGPSLDPQLRSLDGFKRRRNEELFGTNDPRSLKFRYQRQLSYHYAPYDPERYGDYPAVLKEELAGSQRFEVVYRNGRPWTRVDREDREMLEYEPTSEDLAWDPEAFLRRLLSPEDCRRVGIDPPEQ